MVFSRQFYKDLKEGCEREGIKFDEVKLCNTIEWQGEKFPSVWVVENTSSSDIRKLCGIMGSMEIGREIPDNFCCSLEDEMEEFYDIEEVLTWEQLNLNL